MKCLSPFTKKPDQYGKTYSFPCNKCFPCLQRIASGWSMRLMKEEERSCSSYFLTLTYEVPTMSKNKFMTLNKRHHQLFIKKLRKAHEKETTPFRIKYFTAGEYGTKSKRPHYHTLLFNANLDVLIGEREALCVRRNVLRLEGTYPFKCPMWEHGHITIGTISEASVGYTLKYIMKTSIVPVHKNDDRLPEFRLMSKKLGDNYLSPQMVQWHKNDLNNRYYVPLKSGQKIAMPRYLKEKIYTDSERKKIALHLESSLEVPEYTGKQEIDRFEVFYRKINKQRLNQTL